MKKVIIRNCAGQDTLQTLVRLFGAESGPEGRYFVPRLQDPEEMVNVGKGLKLYTRVSDLGDMVMLDMMRYREWRDKLNRPGTEEAGGTGEGKGDSNQ